MSHPAHSRFLAFMRMGLVGVGLACGATFSLKAENAQSASSQVKTASGTAAAREILHHTYSYDPKVRQKADADAAMKNAGGGLQMETVVVTDDKDRNPSFENFVARQRQLKAAQKPSVAGGVQTQGRIGTGIIPYVETIPFGTPTPRWGLIKMPW